VTHLKSVVLLLVLANIGYFLWARGIASSGAPRPERVSAPTLTLATEAPRAASVDRAAAAATPGEQAASAANAGAAESAPPRGAQAQAAAPPDATRCLSIGPFLDVAEAARAAATLRGGGYQPRQRVAEGDVWAGEWVYLPMPAAPAAAAQLRAKLQAGGIEDALEMPGPDDLPVVSLGLFSEPKRAGARIQLARSLGLKPVVADRKRTGDVYWIDVDLKPTDGNLNPADLEGQSGRIVRLQVVGCPAP